MWPDKLPRGKETDDLQIRVRVPVILFKGEQCAKTVNGNQRLVTPFAGVEYYEGEIKNPTMGVGILFNDTYPILTIRNLEGDFLYQGPRTHLEGYIIPRDLVAAYRGMLMVQEMQAIHVHHLYGNLQLCYDAARNETAAVEKVVSEIGAEKLENILSSPLPSHEFDSAVRCLQERGIPFDVQPLLYALDSGTLAHTLTLDRVVAEYRASPIQS